MRLTAEKGHSASSASPAHPGTPVDLELVIASDISLSVDAEERKLQREGYAGAMQDRLVVAAITGGPLGRIAVTYVEWSGQRDHKVVVPWTLIDSNDTAVRFAHAVKTARTKFEPGATAIGNALRFSAKMFNSNSFAGMRHVIDISGDGSSNDGISSAKARDDIVREGITINGLPIELINDRPLKAGEWEMPGKVEYLLPNRCDWWARRIPVRRPLDARFRTHAAQQASARNCVNAA